MLEPIIICGMGHSGTTAVARYLGSAPGWRNYTSGIPAHQELLECQELLHPTVVDLICVPSGPAVPDGSRGDAIRRICEAEPAIRYVFKRPWIERDPDWCLGEFDFPSIWLVCVRPFPGCWTSWNKPGSVLGCRLQVNGPIEDGWALWQAQMLGAARLIGQAPHAAFVCIEGFARNPRLLDQILSRWGISGDFDSSSVDPTRL